VSSEGRGSGGASPGPAHDEQADTGEARDRDARSGARLQWPPGRHDPRAAESPDPVSGPGRLVEPPAFVQPPLRDERAIRADRWLGARLVESIVGIERVWLGVEADPLAELARVQEQSRDTLGVRWRGGLELAAEVCPRCGGSAGMFESDSSGCSRCRAMRLPWAGVVRLGAYEGELRDAIHAFKYQPWRRVGVWLGRRLGEAIGQRLEAVGLDPSRAVVVPMPTTFRRRMSRGIDHAGVLAREVRRELGCALIRAVGREHRPSQLDVAPSQRAANVAKAFRSRSSPMRGGRSGPVVVIDDVMTSGSSMRGACRSILAGERRREERVMSGSISGNPAMLTRDRIWVGVLGVAEGGPRSSRG